MTSKPTAFQKLLHRIFMLRPVTEFFAPRVNGIDNTILRLTKGKFTGSEMMGWNIIQLSTMGARSGEARTMPMTALFDSEKIILVASNFGRKNNPAWYYNLKAHPECEVEWKGKTGTYQARETLDDEYDKYWQFAVSNYEGYDKYKERAGRKIPVMVLEPKR